MHGRKVFRAKRAHGGRSAFGRFHSTKSAKTRRTVRVSRKTKAAGRKGARSKSAKSTGRGVSKRRRVTGYRSGGGVLVRGAANNRGQFYREASGIQGRAIGKSGPRKTGNWWDQYIYTDGTTTTNIDPHASTILFGWMFLPGDHVSTMLTNIRTESPFTLTGGSYVLQPTLYVNGQTVVDIYAASNTSVRFELCLYTRRQVGVKSTAGSGTDFTNAWSQSYDAIPTGYASYPTTSLLENRNFWTTNYNKLAGRRTGVARPGKPVRLTFKFKTRRLTYEEYANAAATFTNVLYPSKSYQYVVKFDGELGQICGVKSAVNQPILGEVNSNLMFKTTTFYRYTWVAGSANQKPTIYGSNLGTGESVDEDALCWTSVPALKATRHAAGVDTSAGLPSFGALDITSRHEANINFKEDCAGGTYLPGVTVT